MAAVLQVPPALNRFTKAADKNLAETVFKLLLKYRPEDKAAKKQRLLSEVPAPCSNSLHPPLQAVHKPMQQQLHSAGSCRLEVIPVLKSAVRLTRGEVSAG